MKFEFYTEDGVFGLDYKDYLKNEDLMKKIADKRRIFVNLGLKLLSFDRQWLREHPKQEKFVEHMRDEQAQNPLRFFLPHCATYDDFDTPSHQYINDVYNIYTAFLAPNRLGKSTATIIKALVTFGVIPTDKSWEIHRDHGVIWREWTGPKEIGVASYNWSNIDDTVWPQVVRAWLPKNELGAYFDYNAPKDSAFTVPLACGSKLHFKALSQPQGAFESQALDGWIWDEQATEEKFDGANARLKTRRTYSTDDKGYEYLTAGWHVCGATPHKVDGRPDTGDGTWFSEMWRGTLTKGLSSKFYTGNLFADVPDWCYSEREKQVSLNELEEAVRTHNKKRVRAIRSRLYGEFETTGGMVYDEWDDEMHIIPEIKIDPTWSAFRCVDHGRTNPTACLWAAITPKNEVIFFQEYEGIERQISDNVERIVAMSGNRLEFIGQGDGGFGIAIPRYREVADGKDSMQFIFDVLDGRSFRTTDNGTIFTVGALYQFAGLNKLQGAPLQQIEPTIPLVKEAMRIRPEQRHIITGELGAPRMYVVGARCPGLIRHLKSYRNVESKSKDGNASEKPHSRDDHDLDAMRYGFMMGPSFRAWCPIRPQHTGMANNKGYWIDEEKQEQESRFRSQRRIGIDPRTRR